MKNANSEQRDPKTKADFLEPCEKGVLGLISDFYAEVPEQKAS
jgi:hypothetical protein